MTQSARTVSQEGGCVIRSAPYHDRREDVFVVERPWGRFQQFTQNESSTVKTITIEPGRRLSLQRHQDRAEMWQVLAGPVEVTVDDRSWSVAVGEMVWVPAGAVHRLGNPGPHTALVLELAFGAFDEADIERLQDDYARECSSPDHSATT